MIRKVFFTDCKNLFKSIYAVIIVIGICFIPALYAWLNIYSNHDPYANTGNIKMGVVSLDEGYIYEGEQLNVGDTILEQLRGNDAIDWQFSDSKADVIQKVESEEYYAALVIPKRFTASMYSVFSDKIKRPMIIFYQNQKKNAVANKITETVTDNLQSTLNETFISAMTTKVFTGLGVLKDKISDNTTATDMIEKLKQLKTDVHTLKTTLTGLDSGNKVLKEALGTASGDITKLSEDADQLREDITSAGDGLDGVTNTLNTYADMAKQTISDVKGTLEGLKQRLDDATVDKDITSIKSTTKQALKDIPALKKSIKALKRAILSDITGIDVSKITSACDSIHLDLDTINSTLTNIKNTDITGKMAKNIRTTVISGIETAVEAIESIETMISDSIIPTVDLSIKSIGSILDGSSLFATNFASTLNSSVRIFEALDITLDQAADSSESTNELLELFEKRLDSILDKVDNASDSEVRDILLKALSGDVGGYAEFFSDPVHINTNSIYPASNYGSSVSPFYTVLALWVGALILAAIIKVHPSTKHAPGAKDRDLYFGRLILFIILGQIQAMIIAWGDLVLLKIDCREVLLFVLSTSFISLTLTMLIYSLVYTFGDIGKAIAVVLVVLQIAGSSGTYPIELLPDFFQKVYIFLPFPYAINALRECVGGRYEADIFIYLLKLSAFIVVALVIGIFIRKPFSSLNHYVEKRMEDTEMM